MIAVEIGINHFGSKKELDIIFKKLLKSKVSHVTIMCHHKTFYNKFKNKIKFELTRETYQNLIKKFKKNKIKLGLSVCDYETFKKIENLNFSFYKLLSIAIDNNDLISALKKKNKKIFISTGFGASLKKIQSALKLFGSKTNVELLHTPVSYNAEDLNLSKINLLKKKFKKKTGYSHHYFDDTAIYASTSYKPDSLFIYCKQFIKKSRCYPDDNHAILIDRLDKVMESFKKCIFMHKLSKSKIKKKKINVFNEIKK